ncbi:MAG: hypothetical protein KDA79_00120 [Planctomycetaceae bacterium]|nr:hypothetical protein [Planctomycetaceae bacterium]
MMRHAVEAARGETVEMMSEYAVCDGCVNTAVCPAGADFAGFRAEFRRFCKTDVPRIPGSAGVPKGWSNPSYATAVIYVVQKTWGKPILTDEGGDARKML